MASNITKKSYLDGIPFDINPLFVPSELEIEFSTKFKKSNLEKPKKDFLPTFSDIIQNDNDNIFDLSKSFSILNSNYDFLTEAMVLTADKNRTISPTTNSQTTPPSKNIALFHSASKQDIALTSFSTATTTLTSSLQTISNPSFQPPVKSEATGDVSSETTYSKIFYPGLKLLEPIRQHVQHSKKEVLSEKGSNLSKKQESISGEQNPSNIDLLYDTATLDPFNEMELKSINELEELKSILHRHHFENQQQQLQQERSSQNTQTNNLSAHNVGALTSSSSSKSNAADNLMDFGLPKVHFNDSDTS